MILFLYVRATRYGLWRKLFDQNLNPSFVVEKRGQTKNHVEKKQLKTVDERPLRREKCWAIFMERRTTLKTDNLANSSFLPKTTEICYQNVSNVSQKLGGQAVYFVRTSESCPGKTAEVWYKASEITKEITN